VQRKEKEATLNELVSEEDELERALAASLLDKPVKVRRFLFLALRPHLPILTHRRLRKVAKRSLEEPSLSLRR